MVVGEQNGVCLMIINSEISACQLIRRFLGMCAPLFSLAGPGSRRTNTRDAPIVCLSRYTHLLLLGNWRIKILQRQTVFKSKPLFSCVGWFLGTAYVAAWRLYAASVSFSDTNKNWRMMWTWNERLTERTEFEVMPPLFLPHSITISAGNLSRWGYCS